MCNTNRDWGPVPGDEKYKYPNDAFKTDQEERRGTGSKARRNYKQKKDYCFK